MIIVWLTGNLGSSNSWLIQVKLLQCISLYGHADFISRGNLGVEWLGYDKCLCSIKKLPQFFPKSAVYDIPVTIWFNLFNFSFSNVCGGISLFVRKQSLLPSAGSLPKCPPMLQSTALGTQSKSLGRWQGPTT